MAESSEDEMPEIIWSSEEETDGKGKEQDKSKGSGKSDEGKSKGSGKSHEGKGKDNRKGKIEGKSKGTSTKGNGKSKLDRKGAIFSPIDPHHQPDGTQYRWNVLTERWEILVPLSHPWHPHHHARSKSR